MGADVRETRGIMQGDVLGSAKSHGEPPPQDSTAKSPQPREKVVAGPQPLSSGFGLGWGLGLLYRKCSALRLELPRSQTSRIPSCRRQLGPDLVCHNSAHLQPSASPFPP